MRQQLDRSCALIIVDVQNDFCAGGALAVPGAEEIIEPFNRYAALFAEKGATLIATRDWHPRDHCSFASQGGPWPVHCVKETPGAEFHPQLRLPSETLIVSKAENPERESYSFFNEPELEKPLVDRRIRKVFIGGLATDYCVKWTALEAVKRVLETYVLTDAIRALDVMPGDGVRALEEMRLSGVRFVTRKYFD